MRYVYDQAEHAFRPCDEDGNILESIDFKVSHTDRTRYYLCGVEYTEDEIFDLYNHYVENQGEYDYMIYHNDDDFFDMYDSKSDLVREIASNKDYNYYDEYCTFERGIYLKSGTLEGCMDECFFEDMVADIESGVYDA